MLPHLHLSGALLRRALGAMALVLCLWLTQSAMAQTGSVQTSPEESRCLSVEIYVDNADALSLQTARDLEQAFRTRPGLAIRVLDITDAENQARFETICRAFQRRSRSVPLVYTCRQAIHDARDFPELLENVKAALRMTVYTRDGCPHCADARQYLPALMKKYPGLELQYREIISDPAALAEMNALVERHRAMAVSVPVFHVCNQLVIGFDQAATTGARLDALIRAWTIRCLPRPAPDNQPAEQKKADPASSSAASAALITPTFGPRFLMPFVTLISFQSDPMPEPLPPDDAALPLPDEPLPLPDAGLPLPDSTTSSGSESATAPDRISLPVFGELSARATGLPLFTIAVGLVDGFNPCAMWVLLFLLSVLVNLKSRWKIFAVAGTFVAISGAAYFMFMAAWLNVFLLAGLVRWVQVLLGSVSIAIGAVHIKDFFAFKRGLSLSIPESAKPGLYARVRRIVTAENLTGAILGAAFLAVLVNVVELLCTAGLPALYTEILVIQRLPVWQNYAYLLLYIAAYMFDDSIMVGIAVLTLGHRRMQETHGRWLKLLSGLVIAALGLVMIIKPDLLR